MSKMQMSIMILWYTVLLLDRRMKVIIKRDEMNDIDPVIRGTI